MDEAYKWCVHTKGSEHEDTKDHLILLNQELSHSYTNAETRGATQFPDGANVALLAFKNGVFAVCDAAENDIEGTSVELSVDQVIMVPDSDVVLHSLRGAKHLNGKTGVIVEFDFEINRYRVLLEGLVKTVNVKPQNILPAYMGCDKDKMVALAKTLSADEGE